MNLPDPNDLPTARVLLSSITRFHEALRATHNPLADHRRALQTDGHDAGDEDPNAWTD